MLTSSAYCIYVYAADDCQSTEAEGVMNAMFKKTMTTVVMAAVVGCGGFYASVASAGQVKYCKGKHSGDIKGLVSIRITDQGNNWLTYSATLMPWSNLGDSLKMVLYIRYTRTNVKPEERTPSTEVISTTRRQGEAYVVHDLVPNAKDVVIWGDLRNVKTNEFMGHCHF